MPPDFPSASPPASRELRSECPRHGPFTALRLVLSNGREVPASGCPECARIEREREARLEHEQAVAHRLAAATVPPRFAQLRFQDFTALSAEQTFALSAARSYVETFADSLADGLSMIFTGRPGTGKTHLGATVIRGVIEAGFRARYVTLSDAFRELRATWHSHGSDSEAEVLRRLTRFDLMVLDEVGSNTLSAAEARMAFDIVDARYQARRPIIAITNLPIADLKVSIGERIVDRLTEGDAAIIPFSWKSWRQRRAEEA